MGQLWLKGVRRLCPQSMWCRMAETPVSNCKEGPGPRSKARGSHEGWGAVHSLHGLLHSGVPPPSCLHPTQTSHIHTPCSHRCFFSHAAPTR